ncbi:MAG: twitching motility protein PilT [Lachnospiraceae bacterium]|nr:twitching motility protein PilT [Lachnospiraceae bacterium]
MIQLIVGNKGKGKTKHLLDRVNNQIKTASGNIVYLDKSSKHMHELDNKVRLINVTEYPLQNCSEFIGFICGIISQDYDLEQMYLDSFLKIANLEGQDLEEPLKELDKISEQFKVTLVLSISVEEADLPEFAKSKVIISC